MTIEAGLVVALTSLAGAVSKMYYDLRIMNNDVKALLDSCIKERQELFSHILSTDTHIQFKERVAESIVEKAMVDSDQYKTLK